MLTNILNNNFLRNKENNQRYRAQKSEFLHWKLPQKQRKKVLPLMQISL